MALALTTLLLALAWCERGSASPLGSPAPTMASPAPTMASPSPAAAPVLPPLRVSRFYTGDEAGYSRTQFWSVEPAIYFFARVAPRGRPAGKSGAQSEPRRFEVVIRDHMGHEVARMGGPLAPPLDPSRADLPRDCANAPDNGLRIAGTALADRPGRYLALAFMDGLPEADQIFTVKRLRNDGQIVVTSAAVENAAGARRFTFTPEDRGMYAHVTLVNATRDRAHEHLIEVAFEGPSGRVGRVLGGHLHVPKGARLDGRDLPSFNDPQHQDGLLLKGTPLAALAGAWRMVVYVDGVAVREVPFRLVNPNARSH